MGQKLLDPPSVEGWHTGQEWIDGGTLTERVNFAVDTLNDPTKPGVKLIIDRVKADGDTTSPDRLIDLLLELVGPLEIETQTREALVTHAESEGALDWSSEESSAERVVQMLTLVVSAREFQFA